MDILYLFTDAFETGLIYALLALGVFISFRVLNFADLTIEGSVVLGGSITARLLLSNIVIINNPFIVLIISIIFGGLSGFITGFLHTKLKIPAIVSGIISMTALYSINIIVMKGANLNIGRVDTIYKPLNYIVRDVLNINNSLLISILANGLTSFIVVLIFTAIIYWLFGTEIGLAIRAVGMNKQMAKAQGINADKMIIIGLMISNALIALSGSLFTMSNRNSNMDFGQGTIVLGLAAIILGETILKNKTFKRWIISVILGTIIFQLLIGLAIELGFNENNLKLLQAILITVVLANPIIKEKFKTLRKRADNNA